MNKIKALIIIVLIFSSISCEPEKKGIQEDSICLNGFNKIFSEVKIQNKNYSFKNCTLDSNLIKREYYEDIDLLNLVFFTLKNDSIFISVAVDSSEHDGYHKMYFIKQINDINYVDFSSHILGDYSFLKDCSVKMSSLRHSDEILFMLNLEDSRIQGNWINKSESAIRTISFTNNNILINDTLVSSFRKEAEKIFNAESNELLFEIIVYSSKMMIIQFDSNLNELFIFEK